MIVPDIVEQFKRAIEEYPDLSSNGWDYSGTTRHDSLDADRCLAAAEVCLDYILLQKRMKLVSRKRTSYGWKHEVEKWRKNTHSRMHIPNGAFILAAIVAGVPMQRENDSPNCFLALKSTTNKVDLRW